MKLARIRTHRRGAYHRDEPVTAPPPAKTMRVVLAALRAADRDPSFRAAADDIVERVADAHGMTAFDLRCWAAVSFRERECGA